MAELTLEEARRQIDALIAENRRLGEELRAAVAEQEASHLITKNALSNQQRLEEEAISSRQRLAELQGRAAESDQLARQRDALDAQVKRLSQQAQKASFQALAPEEVAGLLERTLQSLSGISQFQLSDADVSLKVAAGRLGDEVLFVLPEPGSTIDSATLHEIKFNLRGNGSK